MSFGGYKEFDIFDKALSELRIELTDYQKQQFIDYYEMLIEKNKVMNLTAITDFKDVVEKHFIDSLSIINIHKLSIEKILDIGTGAGFPGVPIKIVYPMTHIVLLDSLNKRLKFLDEVIEKLGLNNITTLHGRAEDIARDDEYRENFDICVSRAVAKLSLLSEYCIPFVKKGGYFISYKSGDVDNELLEAQRAISILGAKTKEVKAFYLPGTKIERALVKIEKVRSTPKMYPRSAGKPAKEPL